ncbi:DUF2282 domain-containing protein [Teredinibacter waterburyi]|jgi:Predicted integral membrane protein|uniref:BufA1 family periplasmic bufferin-type metallophore n=1 Tax=Teredinibacter waterburyi TaxID=1500538 RepID=UPI00165ED9EF|nr:DUF2282 domain-containing protein [Teredinibacter waterburyi]
MKKMSQTIALTTAIATGLAMAASAHEADAGESKFEKCFGMVKAGKNDCAIKSLGTSCAGSAPTDGVPDAWIYVPKGKCEAIVGGSLTPKK